MTRCFYASFLDHEAAARGVTAAPRVLLPVFQVRVWRVHGVCMACVCMACAWRGHGVCMAWAWCGHGTSVHPATVRPPPPHAPFQAIHGATFHGVPGFAFEPDASGHGGCFRFEPP